MVQANTDSPGRDHGGGLCQEGESGRSGPLRSKRGGRNKTRPRDWEVVRNSPGNRQSSYREPERIELLRGSEEGRMEARGRVTFFSGSHSEKCG
jgi:hypothetical protein